MTTAWVSEGPRLSAICSFIRLINSWRLSFIIPDVILSRVQAGKLQLTADGLGVWSARWRRYTYAWTTQATFKWIYKCTTRRHRREGAILVHEDLSLGAHSKLAMADHSASWLGVEQIRGQWTLKSNWTLSMSPVLLLSKASQCASFGERKPLAMRQESVYTLWEVIQAFRTGTRPCSICRRDIRT